jgi:hypothetical protein
VHHAGVTSSGWGGYGASGAGAGGHAGQGAGWDPDSAGRTDHGWWDGEPPSSAPPPARAGRGGWALAAAVTVVAALVGAAAGSVAGAEDGDHDYAALLAADLAARSLAMVTDAEATCIADGIIAGLGEVRLRRLAMIGDPDQPWPLNELSDAEERTFATVSFGCLDHEHLALHLGDMWFPLAGRTIEARECISRGYVDALPDARTREILVALYTDEAFEVDPLLDEDELAAVAGVVAGCGA